jgi:type I restriction enzyme S subunit
MELKSDYKHTEAGVIPEDWACERLSEFLSFISYGFTNPMPTVQDGVFMITAADINDGRLQFETARKTSEAAYRTLLTAKSKPRKNDILLTKDGTLGRLALVGNETICINQSVAILRPNERVEPLFLKLLLESPRYQKRMVEDAGGSTIKHIYITIVDKMPVGLPAERAEQRAIAIALSDFDAMLSTQEGLIAKKRDLKQAAMQQLLTGQTRLPGFHGEWETKELGKLGTISGAGVDKKIRPGEPAVRLVNYMDVYRRNFIYSKDLDRVVSASPQQAARCAVRKGDVFFTPSSEMPFDIAVSAVAMEDIPDACYSYHVVRLRLDEDWDLNFRAYAFKTKNFFDQAARTCEGSGVRYVITQGKFRQLTIRYPADKGEQAAIATVLSDMDAELATLNQRRDKTRALKQAMMQELLTGKTRLV